MSPAETELAYRAALRAAAGLSLRPRSTRTPAARPAATTAGRARRLAACAPPADHSGGPRARSAQRGGGHDGLANHCRPSRGRGLGAPVPRSDASERQAAGMRRNAEELLRVARQMERLLKKEQAGRVAPGQAPAEVEFDLAALDAVWCGTAARAPVPGVDPAGLRSGGMRGLADPRPRRRARRGSKLRRPSPSRGSNIPCVDSGSTWCGLRPYPRRGRRDHVRPEILCVDGRILLPIRRQEVSLHAASGFPPGTFLGSLMS